MHSELSSRIARMMTQLPFSPLPLLLYVTHGLINGQNGKASLALLDCDALKQRLGRSLDIYSSTAVSHLCGRTLFLSPLLEEGWA